MDSAQFGYSTLTHCITGTDPVVIPGSNQTGGGTYTITLPGVINASNGTVDLASGEYVDIQGTVDDSTFDTDTSVVFRVTA